MSIEKALTDEERLAGLDLNQLKTLVGLVEYDAARDPFPLLGWDAVVGPSATRPSRRTTSNRPSAWNSLPIRYDYWKCCDHHAYVLKSGAVLCAIKGAVDPGSALADHHRKHGKNGVIYISSAYPTSTSASHMPVHRARRFFVEPHDISDDNGTVRLATIASDPRRDPVPTLVDRSALLRSIPARIRRLQSSTYRSGAKAPRSESSKPSTTSCWLC